MVGEREHPPFLLLSWLRDMRDLTHGLRFRARRTAFDSLFQITSSLLEPAQITALAKSSTSKPKMRVRPPPGGIRPY